MQRRFFEREMNTNKSLVDYIDDIDDPHKKRLLSASLAKWLGMSDYNNMLTQELTNSIRLREDENRLSLSIGLYLMKQSFFYWISDTENADSFAKNVVWKYGVPKIINHKNIEAFVWILFSTTQAKTITLSCVHKKNPKKSKLSDPFKYNFCLNHRRIKLSKEGFRLETNDIVFRTFKEMYNSIIKNIDMNLTDDNIFNDVNNFPDLQVILDNYTKNNTRYNYHDNDDNPGNDISDEQDAYSANYNHE